MGIWIKLFGNTELLRLNMSFASYAHSDFAESVF